ncbi:hypothetical protein IFR04_005532 [Cadophora malorum]|uniref:non-specific serine/threonine protein kinase n=1 Tax=Cadophora malorum TaxID=108018 RepID=A0A8H7WBJ0_9HELO|nr:hypothetical protein IFR04_005532 [Cadophora malorum]
MWPQSYFELSRLSVLFVVTPKISISGMQAAMVTLHPEVTLHSKGVDTSETAVQERVFDAQAVSRSIKVGSYTTARELAIVMSPLADSDLKGYLVYASDCPENNVLSPIRHWFGCLATAVRYLHLNQIRHRDIKPGNILVHNRQVLLVDFGLAWDWKDAKSSTTSTYCACTRPYAAPEVIRSMKRDTSSDIWSLGCVYFEMATVLKGKRISDLRDFFIKRSDSYHFYNNDSGIAAWIDDMTSLSRVDNKPFLWASKMLQENRRDRPSAATLMPNREFVIMRSAIKLIAIYRLINQALLLDDLPESFKGGTFGDQSGPQPLSDTQRQSPLLLSLQVKVALHCLQCKILEQLLTGLQKLMVLPKSWTSCLFISMCLAFLIERFDIASIERLRLSLRSAMEEGDRADMLKKMRDYSRNVENMAFSRIYQPMSAKMRSRRAICTSTGAVLVHTLGNLRQILDLENAQTATTGPQYSSRHVLSLLALVDHI